MSSEVETCPIFKFVFSNSQRLHSLLSGLARRSPRGFSVHLARLPRSIHQLPYALLGMTITEFSALSLASLPRGRLEFPGENAKAAGTRRRILRLSAFADT